MKIIQSIMTNNPCYKAGVKITVKGLMLHSVGCPQPSASVFVNLMNKSTYNSACVHAFIDGNTGDVYQTLPWNHRGWHGGGASNNTHIGVEMCEPACIKYTSGSNFTCSDLATARAVAQRTYDTAVQLFAHHCKEFQLDPLADGVIISHKEGHKRGIASNHGDPEHLWNGLGMGYTMDTFRKAVAAAMGGNSGKGESAPTTSEVPYMVKITASVLNVRKGAGTQYGINTTVKKGEVFTIVDESNGWGKLKSGAGWISLNYTTKLSTNQTIKVGCTVRVKQGAKTYVGGSLASFVYNRNHIVKEINGDRVVITYGGVVVAAVHKDNLILV